MVLLLSSGCDSTQPLFRPRVVDVAPAERRTVPELLDLDATFEAPARVDIRARTHGYLLEQSFDDGTDVEQDQVLFVLQADEYEAAHRAAVAAVVQREAELEAAKAKREASADDADLVRAVDVARAALEESRAHAAQAETELHYTTLRAPIDGRIDAHAVDVGNVVARDDLLATIVQLDPVHVSGTIDAAEIPNLLEAQREGGLLVQVVRPDGDMHERTGRLDVIGGEIDSKTGRVAVRGVLPNPRIDLLAGQETTARLLLRWHLDAVVVPERAVGASDDGSFVSIVGDDDVVERRRVEVGPTHAGLRVVRAGLEGGERVVVGRSRAAVPGRRVQPAPTTIAPRATPALAPRVAAPTPTPSPVPPPTPSPRPEPTQSPARSPVPSAVPSPVSSPVSAAAETADAPAPAEAAPTAQD